MNHGPRESEFKRRVLEIFERLPKQQQLVARYILDHLPDLPFLSVPELSERSGVSEATVVRFAQRVGYEGFADLKADLMAGVRARMAPGVTEDTWAHRPEGDPLEAIVELEVKNIKTTIQRQDREDLERAVEILSQARALYAFGLGISYPLCQLGVYLFSHIGLRAQMVPTSYSSPLEPLVGLSKEDALLVMAFPPYSKATTKVAVYAREHHVPLIAITDRASAPIAREADAVLLARGDNLLLSYAAGGVGVLLNGLAARFALRFPDRTEPIARKIGAFLKGADIEKED